MSIETLLLLIFIVLIIGMLPAWPYSSSFGYVPTAVLTFLLVVFVIWAVAGGRPLFRSSGTLHDVGQDLKSAGRDAADSIRHAVK